MRVLGYLIIDFLFSFYFLFFRGFYYLGNNFFISYSLEVNIFSTSTSFQIFVAYNEYFLCTCNGRIFRDRLRDNSAGIRARKDSKYESASVFV